MSGLSRIQIEQQLAKIGIEINPAKMNIDMPRLMMKINMEAAKMEMDRKGPSFKVNRKKLNADMGLKTSAEFARSFRDKGKSAAMSASKEAAQKGDALGDARRRGNRVAQISRQKTMQAALSKRETNIGLLPKDGPEISWDPGYTKIHWSRYSISIDWDGEYLPQVTIDPKHSIEVFLREKPYFRIKVAEGEDPYAPGRQVDELL